MNRSTRLERMLDEILAIVRDESPDPEGFDDQLVARAGEHLDAYRVGRIEGLLRWELEREGRSRFSRDDES